MVEVKPGGPPGLESNGGNLAVCKKYYLNVGRLGKRVKKTLSRKLVRFHSFFENSYLKVHGFVNNVETGHYGTPYKKM